MTDKRDKARIASGSHSEENEYFRDIRRDQEQNAKFLALKAAIQEGLDSGVSNRTVGEISAAAKERHKARNG